jgi:hydrophobic/amphiphilic exporter-1 (mainly G- bacteria), HAE1 family
MQVAISAKGDDARQVFEYSDKILKSRLERISGVAEASITGAPERQIQVLLDPAKLASYSLSPARRRRYFSGQQY